MARAINPKMNLGALPSGLEGGAFDSAFFLLFSHPPNAIQPALIAVQPSLSTIHCKALNNFSKVCYSLPCISNPIFARLP